MHGSLQALVDDQHVTSAVGTEITDEEVAGR